MSFKCKFCGYEYELPDDRVVPVCCNEAFYSKGMAWCVEIKKVKKK